MSNTLIRAAIVGCGRIGGGKDSPSREWPVLSHAQAYYRHPRFSLVAAVDNDSEQLRTFREVWNVPKGYAEFQDLLNEITVDVISLCTPSPLHALQIQEILVSPRSPEVVFAEKPVCLNSSELLMLMEASSKSESQVVVNYSRRFDSGHIRLAEYIQNQELGNLLQGKCDYYGGWLNNGCHVIDTLRMLFKEEPVIRSVAPGAKGRANDSCLDLKLDIGNAPVEITSFDESYYQLYESEFRFEHGRVTIRDFGTQVYIEKAESNKLGERVLISLADSPWPGLESPIYHAVDLIAKHLDEGMSLAGRGVLLNEATGTMHVLWQALEHLKTNEKVST